MEFKTSKKYFAPAKVNLSLNITGKRADGYHLLHSLTVFADFGDEITINPTNKFSFTQESEFENLPLDDNNLVIKTATRLAKKLDLNLNCHLHLKKNIPIGAGLGGGSSDAAATVKALLEFWDIDFKGTELNDFLLSLGADVPVCYHAQPCIFEGVGEIIKPAPTLPLLYAVLVYPNKFCSTVDVFKNYRGQYSTPPLPQENIWDYLKGLKNDLTDAAIENIPEIQNVLESLNTQINIIFARMSGSGSCCFGIFESQTKSIDGAKKIKEKHPEWWVKSVILNG